MLHKLLLIYTWFVRTLLFFFPDSPFFMRLRGKLYSFGLFKCGKNFQITSDARLNTLEKIEIGDNVYIANNSILLASEKIIIEDNVLIGPNVVIVADNHTLSENGYRFGEIRKGKIIVKKGSWIGASSTILKSSILPENSVLAANSVLNRQFFENCCVYGGIPAKKIKKIKSDE